MIPQFVKTGAAFIRSRKTLIAARLGTLGIGIIVDRSIAHAFDYLLYPYIIWSLGILKGGLAMTAMSFLFCYWQLRFYDWSKTDWFAIETIKATMNEMKEYGGESAWRRIIAAILKKSDVMFFLFTSIKFDPFYTVVVMREGSNLYNGLNKRDWKIFLLSVGLSNIYWWMPAYLIAYTGVSAYEHIQVGFHNLFSL